MAIKSYPSVGEAYADVTFALGFALTQWHTIEHKLYQLFVYLCGNSDENADSDEVARSFRDDAAHGFRHDVAQGVSLAGC